MEESKEPEPSQSVVPEEGASRSVFYADELTKVKEQPIEPVQQSTDLNQATLLAF